MARRLRRIYRQRHRAYRAGPLYRFRRRVRWMLAQRARVRAYRRFFRGRDAVGAEENKSDE